MDMNKLNKQINQQKAIILYRHSLHCSSLVTGENRHLTK